MNPYSTLKKAAKDYADKLQSRKRRCVGSWPKSATALDAPDFRTRLNVAVSLGYTVEVKIVSGEITMYYVDPLPSRPWQF